MKISDLDKDHQIKSRAKSVKVCVNGLLCQRLELKKGSSTTLSVYGYVADDED